MKLTPLLKTFPSKSSGSRAKRARSKKKEDLIVKGDKIGAQVKKELNEKKDIGP